MHIREMKKSNGCLFLAHIKLRPDTASKHVRNNPMPK